MAFPIPPQTFSCGDCHWKMTTPHSVGDVRIPGLNHFTTCPRCAGGRIEQKNASAIEITMAKLGLLARQR